MRDPEDDTTGPMKSTSGSGSGHSPPRAARRWHDPQPAKNLEPLLPLGDKGTWESANAAEEDQDSSLNDGWKVDGLKDSGPKRDQPKPPEPQTGDSSSDDTGDSSCI